MVEIRHENRFEQYDLNIDLPPPLVPRRLRLPDPRARSTRKGRCCCRSTRRASRARSRCSLRNRSRRWRSGSCTASPIRSTSAAWATRSRGAARRRGDAVLRGLAGDARIRALLHRLRQCLLQPLIGRYLAELERELARAGFDCPLLLMTSGGGITTIETAIRFPVRLVESGPAGGAIFAAALRASTGSIRSCPSTWAGRPQRSA